MAGLTAPRLAVAALLAALAVGVAGCSSGYSQSESAAITAIHNCEYGKAESINDLNATPSQAQAIYRACIHSQVEPGYYPANYYSTG